MESDSQGTRLLVQQALQLAQELERRAGLTSSETAGARPALVPPATSGAVFLNGLERDTSGREMRRTVQASQTLQVDNVNATAVVTPPGLQSPGPNGGATSALPVQRDPSSAGHTTTRTLHQRPPVTPILAPAPVVAPAAPTLATPNSVLRHAAARSQDSTQGTDMPAGQSGVPVGASQATTAASMGPHGQDAAPARRGGATNTGAGAGEAVMSPELQARLQASPMLRLAHENLKLKAQLAASEQRGATDRAVGDARVQCALAAWAAPTQQATRPSHCLCLVSRPLHSLETSHSYPGSTASHSGYRACVQPAGAGCRAWDDCGRRHSGCGHGGKSQCQCQQSRPRTIATCATGSTVLAGGVDYAPRRRCCCHCRQCLATHRRLVTFHWCLV